MLTKLKTSVGISGNRRKRGSEECRAGQIETFERRFWHEERRDFYWMIAWRERCEAKKILQLCQEKDETPVVVICVQRLPVKARNATGSWNWFLWVKMIVNRSLDKHFDGFCFCDGWSCLSSYVRCEKSNRKQVPSKIDARQSTLNLKRSCHLKDHTFLLYYSVVESMFCILFFIVLIFELSDLKHLMAFTYAFTSRMFFCMFGSL